ncbi:hypothetical protein B9Z19DRAFT_987105, partial [Tuber borchii]
KFCFFFLHFFASNCLQMSLFTILLEGVLRSCTSVLSYNPPVRKSVFKSFDHFLIQPPSLQHCQVAPLVNLTTLWHFVVPCRAHWHCTRHFKCRQRYT